VQVVRIAEIIHAFSISPPAHDCLKRTPRAIAAPRRRAGADAQLEKLVISFDVGRFFETGHMDHLPPYSVDK
jgi:hypothetical protein